MRDLAQGVMLPGFAGTNQENMKAGAKGTLPVVPIRRQLSRIIARALIGVILPPDAQSRAQERDFREKVAPIFERHCVVCHQGEKPKGGLSLVSAAGLAGGGETGKVVEPRKP